MTDRALVWLGSSRADLRRFPEGARRIAGFQLRQVQRGFEPDHWKPMPSVGLGVREIRIRTELQHRVLYVTRFKDVVCVIHAFEKRSRKSPRRELELARHRLQLFETEWLQRAR